MNHLFIVTHQDKSKLVPVEGTEEYAIQYISGYVQALRDRFGKLGAIKVEKAPNNNELIINDPDDGSWVGR